MPPILNILTTWVSNPTKTKTCHLILTILTIWDSIPIRTKTCPILTIWVSNPTKTKTKTDTELTNSIR